MEIILASKRKLGFVTRAVARDTTDAEKGEQWDTCNHMVISWIMASVNFIKRSILLMNTAREI